MDEDEAIRLDAVYKLLTIHCENNNGDSARAIAKRLFRGLCSSRKNARQGFYVALVGALSLENRPFGTQEVTLDDIIQILEGQTTPESGTSGQDERDHRYGRLLGCKALLESNALWISGGQFLRGWDRIVDILCRLMAQKPWLRAESNIVMCSVIPRILKLSDGGGVDVNLVVTPLFERLQIHKLLKTVEGIGIWLEFLQQIPKVKLPKDVWAYNSPLHANELQSLKKILLSRRGPKEGENNLMGTSVWSPRLHPAWTSIIRRFRQPRGGQVSFEKFWHEVVDQGLFDPSSTPERKHTGFLVLGFAMKDVDVALLPHCFSTNLMASLIQSLQNPSDAYLRQVVLKTFEGFEEFAGANDAAGVHEVIYGLIKGCDFADFDTLTKTKAVSSLFQIRPVYEGSIAESLLTDLKDGAGTETPINKSARKRKDILNIFSRALCQSIHELGLCADGPNGSRENSWTRINDVLRSLFDVKESAVKRTRAVVEWDDRTLASLQEKIAIILEACLAAGPDGQHCFLHVISAMQEKLQLEAEETIQDNIDASWKLFRELSKKKSSVKTLEDDLQTAGGLQILQATLLYEVYVGDTEAIEMLEDVTSMGEDLLNGQNPSKIADPLLEIIITLMSKPSRFRRRACSLVFEAFLPYVSSDGLENVCRIFATKESRVGQQELFENGDDDLSINSNEQDGDEDLEELDSDVEVVSHGEFSEGSDGIDKASEKDESSSNTSDEDLNVDEEYSDDKDDELARFEGALAAALGTRKFNQDDVAELDSEGESDTSSDADMSDSEMMELDDKLAEVFRNQQDQNSAQKLRKEEMKSAKENVINLKNRAIDLTEQFVRSQHHRGIECTKLIVSLIQLAKTTSTSQVANRAIGLARAFAQKNRGARLPKVTPSSKNRGQLWEHLRELHQTAGQKDASNALIETASQINILLCKLLLDAGEDALQDKMNTLSSEQQTSTEGGRRAHEDLWTRYNDWAATSQRPGIKESVAVVKISSSSHSQARPKQDRGAKGHKGYP